MDNYNHENSVDLSTAPQPAPLPSPVDFLVNINGIQLETVFVDGRPSRTTIFDGDGKSITLNWHVVEQLMSAVKTQENMLQMNHFGMSMGRLAGRQQFVG